MKSSKKTIRATAKKTIINGAERQKAGHDIIVLFTLTVISGLFWLIGLSINVYAIAAVGAIFEILWLPVVLCGVLVPIACLVFWVKNKLSLKSKYFLLMLASVAITYFVVTSTNG